MTRRTLFLLACALLLGARVAPDDPVTLFLIGDSTMADKPPGDHPERGWGQVLPRFFDAAVRIENHARNGRSTRSFLAEDRWRPVLEALRPGDHVIIQFGHNDQSREKTDRYTPPEDYRANIVRFVREARERGGIPVLATSIVRRRFTEAGEFFDVHGVYPAIVRDVAAELEVPLLDMHRSSADLLRSLGPEGSKHLFLNVPPGVYSTLPEGKKDDTHFSEQGALRMAELAVGAMRQAGLGIARHLRGTYRNPVLHADYSDPDVLRDGGEYYMTASSFQCVPGLPVLHSRDLVHWTLIGHALAALPSPDFDVARHGEGVWAPAIRRMYGEYRIYYGDPDRGIFVVSAPHPRGPWSAPRCLQEARGWIDPCPLVDDDGTAYLVHAWAKSRAGFNGILTLRRLSADGLAVLDTGTTVFEGGDLHPTIEGPKLHRRNGFYYIFAPAGGVSRGWQTVLRSRSITGPYEARTVLRQGSTAVNGPHQGAWVDTEDGSSWFLHFQDAGAYGRIVHLQPMAWANGWPVPGADPDGDGVGEPVVEARLPVATPYAADPGGSDDFDGPELNLHWQWQGNPSPRWCSLAERPGSLRLRGSSSTHAAVNLWSVPDLLLQKFPAASFAVTTTLTTEHAGGRAEAGLIVMGAEYAGVVVDARPGSVAVRAIRCLKADSGSAEEAGAPVPVPPGAVHLRVTVAAGGICTFSYSMDGRTFLPLGEEFRARKGRWIGAKVGLFARTDGEGYADVDWFRITS